MKKHVAPVDRHRIRITISRFQPTANDYDFSTLAENIYPTKHGNVGINFQDDNANRELSRAILAVYYELNVTIPKDTLCPAVPSRVSYLQWIHDLIKSQADESTTHGIDVGTGATCIYPLLGCRMYERWEFLATDIQETSVKCAEENVHNNKLASRITILQTDERYIFPQSLACCNRRYTFTMCNPPYYADQLDMDASRQMKRSPQRSKCTGNTKEMETEGGEEAFLTRMIDESTELRDRVDWFTTLVGKKRTLDPIMARLKAEEVDVRAASIRHGQTTRWLVGWRYKTKQPSAVRINT